MISLKESFCIQKCVQQQIEADGLEKARQDGKVVLDCFAGIGTIIVVLKRLGIKIRKVIHVEHDKIFTKIVNTTRNYQKMVELSMSIWTSLKSLKTTESTNSGKNIAVSVKGRGLLICLSGFFLDSGMIISFYCCCLYMSRPPPHYGLSTYLAIDLIIGGPPCIDYNAVNAGRQGVNGTQGSYLLRFGRLIRDVERLQERNGQQKLFLLVENVFLKEQDLVEIRDAFGIDWNPFEFDAHSISP
jgi:hypothetical protein